MNIIFRFLTQSISVVLSNPKIVKKCYNESPEFACRLVGGKPAMVTATNIMKYSQALKACNANSAIVGGWNGEAGLFVLTKTNTLTPYEPLTNTSSHVICDNVDSRCTPSPNPCVMSSEHRIEKHHSPSPVYTQNSPEAVHCYPQPVPYKPEHYTPLPAPRCLPRPDPCYPQPVPCLPKPKHCYPLPAPCPPRPCPPIPYPPRPCLPIPYPEHHHGHHHEHHRPHHRPSSSSSSCLGNSGSQEQLCALLLTSLLKSDSKSCLAPLLEALKSEDTNLLCCNKLCDSNLIIDPVPETPKPKPDPKPDPKP